jgi:SAM-dependent methyltransferase
MQLGQIVPWGRSFDEYVRMFALSESDLAGRILGAGDGPAGFNADMHRRGGHVVSCDPIYALGPEDIEGRIAATYEKVLAETRRHQEDYIWDDIPSVEALGQRRMAAMREFIADYRTGRYEGRYVAAALPHLPFANATFDLVLCSHLLFLYTDQLDEDLHIRSVLELGRVAREVRIFPILDLQGRHSAHLPAVMRACESTGWQAVIEIVAYEFQRGSNRILRIPTGS